MKRIVVLFLFLLSLSLEAQVKVGSEVLFSSDLKQKLLKGKKVGLITNQTAIDADGLTTFELFARQKEFQIAAVFAPEHGFYGSAYASESIADGFHNEIPIYSLHGGERRPTKKQLEGIDVLIFDMQEIGTRSYTFNGTLFYCMEEAARAGIDFIVLDRPNPGGGLVVDGPLMEEECRSFLGYINIPYYHGMTIGELARLFNREYKIGCNLTVVPMQGWKRGMTFSQTGLRWVPTSPQIPEAETALVYPTTGLLGQCSNVSIGVGYTLPFKVIGAPWIDPDKFAAACNSQKLPGVHFQPFYFRPFFGRYKNETCKGILIVITNPNTYLPVTTGYTLTGVLKALYPFQFEDGLKRLVNSKLARENCHKINGKKEILTILQEEKYVIWKLREICEKDRRLFLNVRKNYLIPDYS